MELSVGTVLTASPMFQLSLAARELFHSNFLGWLLETYPQLLKPLFGPSLDPGLKLVPRSSSTRSPWVRREYLNLDLCLELEDAWLVIENKVKSVPRAEQLREYQSKWESKPRPKRERKPVFWLLLTLTAADHDVLRDMANAGKCEWRGLTYVRLADRLRVAVGDCVTDPYHAALIDDWMRSVEAMASIAGAVSPEWPHATELPRGLHDLIWKRAASHAARALAGELRERLPSISVTTDLPLEKHRPRTCNVYSNLTRGTGLFGFSILFDPLRLRGQLRSVALGIQVQAGGLKCYVEFQVGPRPSDADDLRRIAMHLFDVGSVALEIPHWGGASTKGVGTYSGNHYYRTRKIEPGTTVDALVNQLVSSALAIARVTPDQLQRALLSDAEAA